MSSMIQKVLVPAPGSPSPARTEESARTLDITVVFTSVRATLAALKHAGQLAGSLGARITLLVPQVVPYPLPLESPPVPADFNDRRFRVIAGQSPIETHVQICLCRDRLQTLKSILKPASLVLLGGRKRWWWPSRDRGLAQALRRAGHEVIFQETE